MADGDVITLEDVEDVEDAKDANEAKLDSSFFRVRLDRATHLQIAYMCAMAQLGADSQKAADETCKAEEVGASFRVRLADDFRPRSTGQVPARIRRQARLPGVMQYVPFRVKICESGSGAAVFSIDRPGSALASFDNSDITKVGASVDRRLGDC